VSRSTGWDPERGHAAAEVVGVDVSAGLTAGEQPPVGSGDGAGQADLASPGQLMQQAGERFGDLDVVLAEADGQGRWRSSRVSLAIRVTGWA
jgi:hypothetical protein